ncbi:MAG: phosphate acyltransferase [Clostridium sp.]|nr:phosphate acyltransferase [Clostridium sp.]
MNQIKNFEELLNLFRSHNRKRRVVFVCPDDEHTAEVIGRCMAENLAEIILVSVAGRPLPCDASKVALSLTAATPDEAAATAVDMVRKGQADVIMKGNINTDNLLRAILKDHALLQPGRIMSHLTIVDTPLYDKLILFSDAAVIPRPTLEQFEAMIRYDIAAAAKLGVACPKVALIHFTEKINPKFPHTLDYQTILERQTTDSAYGASVTIGGPMDVKTACDPHSGQVKGIVSPVCGDADILVFPNLEAGNTFYKTMSLFGRARMAGVVTGTDAPVVVPSRADSSESKFFSLALACVLA